MRPRIVGLLTTFVGGAALVAIAGGGTASATPLSIPPGVPPNGVLVPGQTRAQLITSPTAPIQVPTPVVTHDGDHTTITARPFFAPWFHNVFPVPAGTAADAQGAIQADFVDPVSRKNVTVDVAGHCLFVGRGLPEQPDTAASVRKSTPPPIRIDTPVFKVSIDPTLWLPRAHP